MADTARFQFGDRALPYIPLQLSDQEHGIAVEGLIDTGSTVNVLPYHLGEQLGLQWDTQTAVLELAGHLRDVEARGILLSATVNNFSSVFLAFAWARSSNIPVILGHINFLREFEVCFYNAQFYFELCPRKSLNH